MRLGEIKQILDRGVSASGIIEIKYEAMYGGQAYKILNPRILAEILGIIFEQSWNKVDKSNVLAIKNSLENENDNYGTLSNSEYSQLQSYINNINQSFPVFYNIISSFTEEQDPQTINIRLPSEITSLQDLNTVNKRIGDVLKFYNIDGQFELKGFDKGSSWYIVSTVGFYSFNFMVAGLIIAQRYFEAKKSYYESKTAELDYRAALNKDDVEQKEIEEFNQRRLKLLIEDEVKKAIEEIGLGNNNVNETQNKLIKATTELIKELGNGTEFHLSLNPPEYADEKSGMIKIDYSSIPRISEVDLKKQLKAPDEE